MHDNKRIIVALDMPDAESAVRLADQLDPALCRVKVGKELFTRAGPQLIERLTAGGFEIFLDLKFHDIPNTVRKAVLAAAELGVWMLTLHASGGKTMMMAAREALQETANQPLLIAVTVLTSMGEEDLAAIGIQRSPLEQVQRLAALAHESAMDGVVCSAQEAVALRQLLREDFVLVTPGIRPEGAAADDQKRVMTPGDAIRAGSSYLVIGRPISRSTRPGEKLLQIHQQISGAIPNLC